MASESKRFHARGERLRKVAVSIIKHVKKNKLSFATKGELKAELSINKKLQSRYALIRDEDDRKILVAYLWKQLKKKKSPKKESKAPKEKKRKPDIIERYCDLLSGGGNFEGFTDSRRDYQEAVVLFLISTFIGPKARIRSAPETKFVITSAKDLKKFKKTGKLPQAGTKQLNLWFMLIGKSRITRRTTSMMKALNIIRFLNKNILLSYSFTPASLIKKLAERAPGEACAWVHDEILGFFELLSSKGGHMSTADSILSILYDGHTYGKTTIARGDETVEDPYLTSLLSSTETLPKKFDAIRIEQGFLNRFIYVVLKRGPHMDEREDLTYEELIETNYIVRWFKALRNFSSSKVVYTIVFSPEAKQQMSKFNKLIERKIEDGTNPLKEGFLGNQPNLAKRLAAIYRIARFSREDFKNPKKKMKNKLITVEIEDMERALAYLKNSRIWFNKMLILRGAPVEAKPPTTAMGTLPYLLNKIKQHGHHNEKTGTYFCKRDVLRRKMGYKKKDLEVAIEEAVASGRVKVHYKQKKSGPGRPTLYYEIVSKKRKKKGKKKKKKEKKKGT